METSRHRDEKCETAAIAGSSSTSIEKFVSVGELETGPKNALSINATNHATKAVRKEALLRKGDSLSLNDLSETNGPDFEKDPMAFNFAGYPRKHFYFAFEFKLKK